ncbi:MAG TPA: HEAT repeat domain-containing protein, partial [Gemmataceae bacterium]|nr:HEAT repeat domain-containing protein [Gemmataceae bacterium]
AAESAVREQLHNPNNYARIAAIKVLKVIGSAASQKDLIEAANDHFDDVAQAAREALPPKLRPLVVEANLCVTINIRVRDYQEWPAIEEKIKALADSPKCMCKSYRQQEYIWVTLGPVKDPEAFARKINFGKVTATHPERRLIYVDSGK